MLPNEHGKQVAGLDLITADLPSIKGPFRNIVDSAIARIRSGDMHFAPVDQIVFGKLNALADAQQLDPQNWEIVRTDGNVIILNKDFQGIQDDFGNLEDNSDHWNGESCKHVLGKYMSTYSSQRREHANLLQNVLVSLEGNGQVSLSRDIKETWAKENGYKSYDLTLNNFITSNRLVAIPWVEDSPYVWEQVLKIPKELTDRYSSVKKINEIGLIFASRKYRGLTPPSHDYFSYASNIAKQRSSNIENTFLSTASHEGSHGPIESVTTLIAGIPELSFISEGFPSVFGNDHREYDSVDSRGRHITIDLLINSEQEIDDSFKKSIIYVGGARFYRTLLNILQVRKVPEPWNAIAVNLFLAANETRSMKQLDENNRLSFFSKSFLTNLNISSEELDKGLQKFEGD